MAASGAEQSGAHPGCWKHREVISEPRQIHQMGSQLSSEAVKINFKSHWIAKSRNSWAVPCCEPHS